MLARHGSVLVETRRAHLRDLGLPTIFGAAVLFVCATLLLGVNISALRSNLAWAERSQTALRDMANLETAVMGEEMTVRGFALTGDRRFLIYQDSERHKMLAAWRELQQLTEAEREQRALLRTLRPDVDRHLAVYGGLKGTGPDQASHVARAIVDRDTRAITERLRAGLAKLRSKEELGLAARMREMTSQISRAFFLSVGIILAAVLLGTFGLLAWQFPFTWRG
jgi:CHASE3 domain sensor protein